MSLLKVEGKSLELKGNLKVLFGGALLLLTVKKPHLCIFKTKLVFFISFLDRDKYPLQ